MEIKKISKVKVDEVYYAELKRKTYKCDGSLCHVEDLDSECFLSDFENLILAKGAKSVGESILNILADHNKMVKTLSDVERHFKQSAHGIERAKEEILLMSETIKNRTHKAGK